MGGGFGGAVCAVARSIVRCAGGGVGSGRIASVRSTSGDSAGLAGSAWTWARTTTVASPSSSMLEDDSARFERARPRVFSGGCRLHRLGSTHTGRRTNEFLRTIANRQNESCGEPQETEDRGGGDGCDEHEQQHDGGDGDDDDENRENDYREDRTGGGDRAEERCSGEHDELEHAIRRRAFENR